MSFGIQTESSHTTQPHADQHDAMLMVELFKIRHSPEMAQAWAWFEQDFKVKTWATIKKNFPPGSEGYQYLHQLLDFWEMVGAFVYHNVLHAVLLFDVTTEPVHVWAKVEPWANTARKELGSNQWAFIEGLAQHGQQHLDGI